jgi:ABC-type Mn2+/Zn2+ transport system permease subunit
VSAPEPGAEKEQSASDIFGAALGGAARRAGLDPSGEGSTSKVVWSAIGGWRGILESVLPSLAFVILFTLKPEPLILALGVSVGLAAVFTIVRLIQKSPPSAAIGGLVAAAAAAGLALWTGRGEDNFVPGLITNAVYGSVLLVSALIGWSLIGVAAGFLMGEGTAWRADRRKRRAFLWLGIAWAALFFARLAVQLPLYLAGDVTALGTLKLIMGLPLFAPLIAVTWLVVRALYPRAPSDEAASSA